MRIRCSESSWPAAALLTLQGIPGETQLADDVARDVTFDALTLLGMTFSCLQQVVELLRVKLLQQGHEEEEEKEEERWRRKMKWRRKRREKQEEEEQKKNYHTDGSSLRWLQSVW